MPKKPPVLKLIANALQNVMAIELDDLEKVMQQAHECDINQIPDPPEEFPVSRQALRMLWHFRCNLDAVSVFTESK